MSGYKAVLIFDADTLLRNAVTMIFLHFFNLNCKHLFSAKVFGQNSFQNSFKRQTMAIIILNNRRAPVPGL